MIVADQQLDSGKQGRTAQPQDNPTTHVSPVNAHQQHQPAKKYDYAPTLNDHYAISDPNVMAHQAHQVPHGDAYSTNEAGHNRQAQAGNVAAHTAGHHQKHENKNKKVDQEELARIVAEERESKGKLPRYPGLERWQLVEKMGDGAFSNVYKARDLDGIVGEVAIKVVRKFEMNSSQVSGTNKRVPIFSCPLPTQCLRRAMHIYTRTSKSNLRLLRCALFFFSTQASRSIHLTKLSLWVMTWMSATLM